MLRAEVAELALLRAEVKELRAVVSDLRAFVSVAAVPTPIRERDWGHPPATTDLGWVYWAGGLPGMPHAPG